MNGLSLLFWIPARPGLDGPKAPRHRNDEVSNCRKDIWGGGGWQRAVEKGNWLKCQPSPRAAGCEGFERLFGSVPLHTHQRPGSGAERSVTGKNALFPVCLSYFQNISEFKINDTFLKI